MVLLPLYTALVFLTRFPQFLKKDISERDLQFSVSFFPLIGALIGSVLYVIFFILNRYMDIFFLSSILLTVETLVTGGMHMDGLADTCDGIFSGKEKEKKLEIMKDSRLGAFGVMGIIFDVLLKFCGILSILKENPVFLILVPVTGRWLMSFGIVFFPYVREKGLGKAFNCGKGKVRFLISTVISIILFIVVLKLKALYFSIILLFLGYIFALYIVKNLKGMTGDTFGALNEFGEIACLVLIELLF